MNDQPSTDTTLSSVVLAQQLLNSVIEAQRAYEIATAAKNKAAKDTQAAAKEAQAAAEAANQALIDAQKESAAKTELKQKAQHAAALALASSGVADKRTNARAAAKEKADAAAKSLQANADGIGTSPSSSDFTTEIAAVDAAVNNLANAQVSHDEVAALEAALQAAIAAEKTARTAVVTAHQAAVDASKAAKAAQAAAESATAAAEKARTEAEKNLVAKNGAEALFILLANMTAESTNKATARAADVKVAGTRADAALASAKASVAESGHPSVAPNTRPVSTNRLVEFVNRLLAGLRRDRNQNAPASASASTSSTRSLTDAMKLQPAAPVAEATTQHHHKKRKKPRVKMVDVVHAATQQAANDAVAAEPTVAAPVQPAAPIKEEVVEQPEPTSLRMSK